MFIRGARNVRGYAMISGSCGRLLGIDGWRVIRVLR